MDGKTEGTNPVVLTNAEYISAIEKNDGRPLPAENKNAMLVAMDKYGDNHWWLSFDKRIIAYWQLQEAILLVDFSTFHEGVERLLGRQVWTHEFGLCWDGLINEAANAILGIEPTQEEKEEAIRRGMDALYVNAVLHGQTILGINQTDA